MSTTLDDRASRPRRIGRRLLAGLGAAALGVAALAATAPAAHAASTPIASSELHWGVKSSFRTYITTIAGGTITPSDGASREGLGDAAPYVWSGAGGTYDPATNSGTVEFAGKVVFSAPNHTIWHITIANPTVVLDGDSTGVLVADVSYATGGTQAAPQNVGTQTDVAFADLTVGAPTANGPTYTFTDQAAVLTAAGAGAFAGFYPAGTALDALTYSASLEADPPPAPADPLGSLIAQLLAAVAALLGGLG